MQAQPLMGMVCYKGSAFAGGRMSRWIPFAVAIAAPLALLLFGLSLGRSPMAATIGRLVGAFAAALIDPLVIIGAPLIGAAAAWRSWCFPVGVALLAAVYAAMTWQWQGQMGGSAGERFANVLRYAAVSAYVAGAVWLFIRALPQRRA